jgi:hypothetical protein
MDDFDLTQMETTAASRSRSQMKWLLIVFEVLVLWTLLSYTFLVPGDWNHSRLSLTLGFGGAAGICACGSALAAHRSGGFLRRLLGSPQVVVFMLIMIPVLLAAFTRPSR